ncbi:tRNA (adenosine(37)-N6)-threonylcarbamoyltransferase complex dimerization subunit type 1 TsaB [Candidatus Acetothermia bacterium]|nr:tRNA (adenosine(37)-N6)-threonylcarbamoyltransferase complex dimerization subunit type 1 TsaB [Candidatus Acetothermia bacterium]MBI3460759.1 tRNA (adenosine(37)-N6)-threonylcarbamoyltransferase complex dimerization subunit type 1 TsaB [Candidatus Acetothermia bacterium]MBI3658853.1 tRNA (adenosine(37)-N6)-threonylcarbamoyltransferase complex dimerization subunit type 1 TsaB [Candidatus Acetothermia bacterium]
MLTLGIETATDQGAVGLCRGEKLLGEVSFSARMGQAERLVPAIDSLLKLHRVAQKELQLIAVATGPGSFTGLRIGMATAKGLAQALKIPLVGVPSADAFASRVSSIWTSTVCVVLSDRRNLIYDAFFAFAKDEKIAPEQSRTIELLIEELKSRTEKVLCVGTGVEEHRHALEQIANVTVVPAVLNLPSALGVTRLGWEKFERTKQDELFSLEPLYVQRLMAEVNAGH